MKNNQIAVKGIDVRYKQIDKEDYISLTDIAKAKNPQHSDLVIGNWLRNQNTIEYLGLWETLNNPNFNSIEFEGFRKEAGTNAFAISPQHWIKNTNSIGLISKSGRYGGTYAHRDIAFKFASWISVEFELYLIKEFQKLKAEENKQLEWSSKRELAKLNYRIHTDAIKENIVPTLSDTQVNFVYANEADVLNMALFGKTAKQWRDENPDKKGNIRDYATIEQLLVIANMESFNAILIEQGFPQNERLKQLNDMAKTQLRSLQHQNLNRLLSDDIIT